MATDTGTVPMVNGGGTSQAGETTDTGSQKGDTGLITLVRGNATRIINWATDAATRAGAMGNRTEQELCIGVANELSMLTGVPNTWAANAGGPPGG